MTQMLIYLQTMEGYNTSPEVDFDLLDYWALGLNSFLWRIDLYKEGQDGFWTL